MNVSTRARLVPIGVVPARMLLDLAWPVALPGGTTLGQVGGAALVLALAGVVVSRATDLRTLPNRWVWAAWTALLCLGALRAPSATVGVSQLLQLATPALVFAAWHLTRASEDVPRIWLAVAAVPVAISLLALAAGQPADHVLHGWPRLLGAYGNLHSHAAAMAVIGATAAVLAVRDRRWPEGLLAVAALSCLGATWVRGSFGFVLVAVGLALVRRPASLAGFGVLATGLAALGAVRSRFSDLTAILTLTPPPGGWEALGSHRVAIWADATANFLAAGPVVVVFGRGLGGQFGLHRHLDPHNEVLSLWFQLGLPGLLVAGWLLVAVVRDLWRSTDRTAPLALGLVAGAVAAGLVGNDVLNRPTLLLTVCSVAALSLAAAPASPASRGV